VAGVTKTESKRGTGPVAALPNAFLEQWNGSGLRTEARSKLHSSISSYKGEMVGVKAMKGGDEPQLLGNCKKCLVLDHEKTSKKGREWLARPTRVLMSFESGRGSNKIGLVGGGTLKLV